MDNFTIELHPPYSDKRTSFHFQGVTDELRPRIKCLLHDLSMSNPFLQGDSGAWMMIELWNPDPKLIEQCIEIVRTTFQLPITRL
jgi:hypothetical protein